MSKFLLSFVFTLNAFISFSQVQDTTLLRLNKAIEAADTDSIKVEAILNLGEYRLRRDFNAVEPCLREAARLIESTKEVYNAQLQKASIKQQYGVLNRKRADYGKALQYYYEALSIFEEEKDSIGLVTAIHNIGTVYIYQEEYDKGKKYLRKAIAINRRLGRIKSVGKNYNMLAFAHKSTKDNDSVMHFYNKATEVYDKVNYEEGRYQIMGNISAFLVRNKKYKEALPLQLENLNYLKNIQKKAAMATSHYNLASIYMNLKEYDNALKHINDAIAIAKKDKMGRQLAFSYKRRSLLYKNTGKYDRALSDYRKFFKVYDSIYNRNKAKEIREIELNYKFEKERVKDSIQFAEEKKNILAQKEIQELKKKWYFSLFIITMVIMALLIFYGVKYYKTMRRRNEQKEIQLTTTIDELQDKVSVKEEEVTELVKETLIQVRTKEKLAEDLTSLSYEENGTSLKTIIAQLKADKLRDDKLVLLRENIEKLNYEFLKNLRTKHPDLTKTDIEICSFIKIGLTRKEIINLRKTSLAAIKSSRFRLKKKFQLSPEESLDDYIKSI